METQIAGSSAPDIDDNEFIRLLGRSRAGDAGSLLHILELLEPDIQRLSRFMGMDRQDAAQTLRTELIQQVMKGHR
ncbi:hypothetical protein B9G55_17345 [Saccharibacillus sp. O16]|nr:hypothetical protein B9G55_17345 [Saccharibacillus sp. O16]